MFRTTLSHISIRLLVVPILWRNDHDSPAPLRMEERHSNVVSGNQTIVPPFRICFRCSLTHNDSGRFDWWCRLRHILAGVRVYLRCNQSAPGRFWVLWRPFHVVQPLRRQFPDSELWLLAAGWVPQPPACRCSQALSVDLHTHCPWSSGIAARTTNSCASTLTFTSFSCEIGIPAINL